LERNDRQRRRKNECGVDVVCRRPEERGAGDEVILRSAKPTNALSFIREVE
jgi:hypothetical protein